MKRSNRQFLSIALTVIIFSALTPTLAQSATKKIPIRDITSSIPIQDASEIVGFARFQESLVLAGADTSEKSWVALINKDGSESWRVFPIVTGNGGDGFITALAVDKQGVIIAGLTQNELAITAPEGSAPNPDTTALASPAPTATPAATSSVPVANPDNVVALEKKPFRKDIRNLFAARIDLSGNIVNLFNQENIQAFIPRSIVASGSKLFIVGNEQQGESGSRGAIYPLTDDGFVKSFNYGSDRTIFTRAVAPNSKNLIVVGSSADTIAERKVVGKVDAIILTLSQSSGKISKIVRSNGAGATRSWDFASGNLLVSGTSRTKNSREAVVTSFTSQGNVAWTSRFPRSNNSIAAGNCVAISLTSNSSALPFTIKGPEIFLYTVNSKGERLQGFRLPGQQLISLANFGTKGCALLTRSAADGVRVTFL
jgi:hypothetical protein